MQIILDQMRANKMFSSSEMIKPSRRGAHDLDEQDDESKINMPAATANFAFGRKSTRNNLANQDDNGKGTSGTMKGAMR